MRQWAWIIVAGGLMITAGGCVTGDRLGSGWIFDHQTRDGVVTPTGWVIRYYEGSTHQEAYEAVLAICKDQKIDIEDHEYEIASSELEVETHNGTEIEIQIWAPDGKPMQVGVLYDSGDEQYEAIKFLSEFEKKFSGKRVKPPSNK
jgi:hypothetical protein